MTEAEAIEYHADRIAILRQGPWLKWTFDPRSPGTALVLIRAGSKKTRRTSGRWVVFDAGKGHTPDGRPNCIVFDAETTQECCDYLSNISRNKLLTNPSV